MARRFLLSIVVVVAVAGVAWGVTTLASTETTTVGVKVVRKVRR
jgi:hypothetical protein